MTAGKRRPVSNRISQWRYQGQEVKIQQVTERLGQDTPAVLAEVAATPNGDSSVIKMCPDSGATMSLCSKEMVKYLGLELDTARKVRLRDVQGATMRCLGVAPAYIKAPCGPMVKVMLAVTDAVPSDQFLVSWDIQVRMGILPEHFPNILPKGMDKKKWKKDHQRMVNKLISRMKREEAERVRAVRSAVDEAPFPTSWPSEITEVLDKYTPSVLTDEFTPERRIKDAEMKIVLKEGAVPYKTTHSPGIPFHYEPLARKMVDDMCRAGIIRQLTENDPPSDWLAPAFFAPKPGQPDKLRLLTDFRHLNSQVSRPVRCFNTGEKIWRKVKPDSKFFISMDALGAYHQIPISEDSKQYCRFLLPWAAYEYLAAPMGFSCSGDFWNILSDEALTGSAALKEVDDILLQSSSISGLAQELDDVLNRCGKANITISRKKVNLTTTENNYQIPFAGFMVGRDGCSPDPKKVDAIANMEPPGDVSSLRSFLGLCNTFSHWLPDLSQTAKPLRELLKKGRAYTWLDIHQEAFDKLKEVLTSDLCLSPFDPLKKSYLVSDASKTGIGFLLLQDAEVEDQASRMKGMREKVDLSRKRLVWCGSAALSQTQYRYPPVMLELLAAVFSMESCAYYLKGGPPFVYISDHLPLKSILKKNIEDIPPRLLPLVERTMCFDFETRFIKGSRNLASDCLSRQVNYGQALDVADEVVRRIVMDTSEQVRQDPMMMDIFAAVAEDSKYMEAVEAKRKGVTKGELKRLSADNGARAYMSIWDHLSTLDDKEDSILVFNMDRIVVPQSCQKKVLETLHLPHLGVVRTKAAARQRYYWPAMNNQVEQLVAGCEECAYFQISRPQEPHLRPKVKEETQAMERIGLDVFHVGSKKYLALVDYYSSYILIKELRRTTNQKIMETLDQWFAVFSSPRVCRADGGEFRESFDRFLAQRGIIREQGAAYQSQSQGLIERNLGTLKLLMKKMLKEGKPWNLAAGELNRAPRASRPSPAEMFYRRYCRSPFLPELPRTVTMADVRASEEARDKLRLDTAVANNKRQEREPMVVGQEVRMQDPTTKLWSREGTIKAVRPSGRSYIVDSGDRLYKRNIKWLRPLPVEQVTVVHDGEGGADQDAESVAAGDDKAGGDPSCSPDQAARAPAPGRRSCMAARSEQRCWQSGEVHPRKTVSWARPLYTEFVLQTHHEHGGLSDVARL